MKNKFYEFKNISENSADLYIYGALMNDKTEEWFPAESDVDLNDFKDVLDNLTNNANLNMYVNSPGGSVFAASTMVSMLKRAKENKKIKITSWIDGLCASAASFLIMVSDEIKLYTNSMLMVHKPMSLVLGNAIDMKKEIDTLNSIEENVMLPLYMNKAKCSRDEIRKLIDDETWLSAEETDKYFNVCLLNETKECTACVDSELFKRYKNVPKELNEEMKELEQEEDTNSDTDNNEKASAILIDKIGIEKMDVTKESGIRIYEKLDEIRNISKTLYENGIIPVEIAKNEVSLEDYYMKMVSGV